MEIKRKAERIKLQDKLKEQESKLEAQLQQKKDADRKMHNAEVRQEQTVKKIISLQQELELQKAHDKIFEAQKQMEDAKAKTAKNDDD